MTVPLVAAVAIVAGLLFWEGWLQHRKGRRDG